MPTTGEIACCGGLAACFCGWECLKPRLMRGVAKVVVKVAPKFLGGAVIELDKISIRERGRVVRIDVSGLKVHNLEDRGYATPLLLSADEISVEVLAGRAVASYCRSRGKHVEVQVDLVKLNGISLTVEKGLTTSNVKDFLAALKKKSEDASGDADNSTSALSLLTEGAQKVADKALQATETLRQVSEKTSRAGKLEKKVKLDLRKIDMSEIRVDMTTTAQAAKGLDPLRVKLKSLAIDLTDQEGNKGEESKKDLASVISRMFTVLLEDIMIEAGKSGVDGAKKALSHVSERVGSTLADSANAVGGGASWLGSFFYATPRRHFTRKVTFQPGKIGMSICRISGLVREVAAGGQAASQGVASDWQVIKVGAGGFSEEKLDQLIAGSASYELEFTGWEYEN